jgi:hypothetical protein
MPTLRLHLRINNFYYFNLLKSTTLEVVLLFCCVFAGGYSEFLLRQ